MVTNYHFPELFSSIWNTPLIGKWIFKNTSQWYQYYEQKSDKILFQFNRDILMKPKLNVNINGV